MPITIFVPQTADVIKTSSAGDIVLTRCEGSYYRIAVREPETQLWVADHRGRGYSLAYANEWFSRIVAEFGESK